MGSESAVLSTYVVMGQLFDLINRPLQPAGHLQHFAEPEGLRCSAGGSAHPAECALLNPLFLKPLTKRHAQLLVAGFDPLIPVLNVLGERKSP